MRTHELSDIRELSKGWKGDVEEAIERLVDLLKDPNPRLDNRDKAAFGRVLVALVGGEKAILAAEQQDGSIKLLPDELESISKAKHFGDLKKVARDMPENRRLSIVTDILLNNVNSLDSADWAKGL